MTTKNIITKIDLTKLSKTDLIDLIEVFDITVGVTLDFVSKTARSDIHEILQARFTGDNKRHVEYTITGENNKVLAKGSCMVADDDDQFYNICDHANIDMDDMWDVETIEDA